MVSSPATKHRTGRRRQSLIACLIATASLVIPASNVITARASSVTAGQQYLMFVNSDGTVWTSGDNYYGYLGNGTLGGTDTFSEVHGSGNVGYLSGITAAAAGYDHALALKSDGTVLAWGYNGEGELGDGTISQTGCYCEVTPIRVSGLTNIVAVAANIASSYALRSDGTVWAWGSDGNGQLGNGLVNSTGVPIPVEVSGLTGVVRITANQSYALAVKSDGTVWGWGSGGAGQLGSGASRGTNTFPVEVHGLSGIVDIAAAALAGVAVKSDGTVWTWGSELWGELANGQVGSQQQTPMAVAGLTGIDRVAAGVGAVLARRASDGGLVAWGQNTVGNLGTGAATTTSCGCLTLPNPVAVVAE